MLKFCLLCVNAAGFLTCFAVSMALWKTCVFIHEKDLASKACKSRIWIYVFEPALKYMESALYMWYRHIEWIKSSLSILLVWILFFFSCLCCRVQVLAASWLRQIQNCQYKTMKPSIGMLTDLIPSKLSNLLQSDSHHLFALVLCSVYSHCSCKWC